MSAKNSVKYKLDEKKPKALTVTQQKRLQALSAMPDSQIDYSDIARTTKDAQWTRPGALVSGENKQQVTLRLDAEVLNFFKLTGKRYQSRINAALREYVKTHSV
jgi:uncharacterized protein (DUF4415 family)